ncbi:MAG: hypothetical protein AAFR61_19935 [Bacteroidota bacterium]
MRFIHVVYLLGLLAQGEGDLLINIQADGQPYSPCAWLWDSWAFASSDVRDSGTVKADIYLDRRGRELLRRAKPRQSYDHIFIVRTTVTTEVMYWGVWYNVQDMGWANPISRRMARRTEALLKAGILEGDHMAKLVRIPTFEAQAQAEAEVKDKGNGGLSLENNQERGGHLGFHSFHPVPPGPFINPLMAERADIAGNPSFHNHPSGTLSNMWGTTAAYIQPPSKHDILTAGNRQEYVMSKAQAKVFVYDSTGVIAVVPLKRWGRDPRQSKRKRKRKDKEG